MRDIIGEYKFSANQYKAMTKAGILTPEHHEKLRHRTSRKFNIGQFVKMAEFGILDSDNRLELIDGVIMEMAPATRPYGNRVSDLARAFAEKRPKNVQVYIGSTIRLSDQTGPQPDIALLTPQASLDKKNIPRPEDILLIIEVSDSTLRTGRIDKARHYAESGIPELWILIVATEEIEIYRQPTPEGYADVQTRQRGDSLTIQALPDVRLTVDELLK